MFTAVSVEATFGLIVPVPSSGIELLELDQFSFLARGLDVIGYLLTRQAFIGWCNMTEIEKRFETGLNAEPSATDPFADYRIPEFKAPAQGQGSKFVEWQMDLGKCSSLLHSMDLLGSSQTTFDKSNDNIYVGPTALSRMTQGDIYKCAESLPPSYYARKDAAGNVNHIGYRADTPDFANPLTDPIGAILLDPQIALTKLYQSLKNLVADDLSIDIKGGKAIYSAPFWYDIQDHSSRVKVNLASQK